MIDILYIQSEVALVFHRVEVYVVVRRQVHIVALRLLLLAELCDGRVLATQSFDCLLSGLFNVLVHLLIVQALLFVQLGRSLGRNNALQLDVCLSVVLLNLLKRHVLGVLHDHCDAFRRRAVVGLAHAVLHC